MKYISILILFILSLNSFGQEVVVPSAHKNSDLYNYHVLKIKPLFGNTDNHKDSEKALYNYIEKEVVSLNFEKEAKAYVSFEIHTDGSIQNVKVVVGKDDEYFNQKAFEIISELPKWKPASKYGKPVKSFFTVEVKN